MICKEDIVYTTNLFPNLTECNYTFLDFPIGYHASLHWWLIREPSWLHLSTDIHAFGSAPNWSDLVLRR